MLLWMNRSNTGCSSKRLGILSNTRPKGNVEYYFKNEWTFYPCIVFHLFKVKPQWQQAKQGVPHVLLAGCTSSSSRGGSHCIPRPDKISLSLPFWVYCRLSYQLWGAWKISKGRCPGGILTRCPNQLLSSSHVFRMGTKIFKF